MRPPPLEVMVVWGVSEDSDGLHSKLISSFQNMNGRYDSVYVYYFPRTSSHPLPWQIQKPVAVEHPEYKCVCLFLIFHWIPLGFRFHLRHSTSLVSGIVSDRIYSSWPLDRLHNSDLAWPLMKCSSLSFDRNTWDNFMTSSVSHSLISAILIVDSWRRNIHPWERITNHLLGCLMFLGGLFKYLDLFIPIFFTNVCSHSSIEIMKKFYHLLTQDLLLLCKSCLSH